MCSRRCTSEPAPAAARSCGRHFLLPLLPHTATRAPPGPSRASEDRRGQPPSVHCPVRAVPLRRGVVQIACGNDSQWRRLCGELGLDVEAGLATNRQRVERRTEVIQILEDAFSSLAATEVIARLEAAGVPAGRVRSIDEVYAWDQTRSQGLLIDVQHDSLGPIQLPGPPLRFFDVSDETEVETTLQHHHPPPLLGASNTSLGTWLGTDPPSQ